MLPGISRVRVISASVFHNQTTPAKTNTTQASGHVDHAAKRLPPAMAASALV